MIEGKEREKCCTDGWSDRGKRERKVLPDGWRESGCCSPFLFSCRFLFLFPIDNHHFSSKSLLGSLPWQCGHLGAAAAGAAARTTQQRRCAAVCGPSVRACPRCADGVNCRGGGGEQMGQARRPSTSCKAGWGGLRGLLNRTASAPCYLCLHAGGTLCKCRLQGTLLRKTTSWESTDASNAGAQRRRRANVYWVRPNAGA